MIDQKIKIPWIYHPDYDVPLPYNHRFSSTKFGDLYSFLIKTKISSHSEIFKPIPATRKQLERVHTKDYINKIRKTDFILNNKILYIEQKIKKIDSSFFF